MSGLESVEEKVEKEINYAKMLIRNRQPDEGLRHIDGLVEEIGSGADSLPPQVAYLIPFTRARAYVQSHKPAMAQAELERAMDLARNHPEASARVENLLGVIAFEQDDPAAALKHHLNCLHAMQVGTVKDINFRLSVYQNLANVYWALDSVTNAISTYKEALEVLQDLDEPRHQANIFWGLGLAYKAKQDWRNAKLYTSRAMQRFEAIGDCTSAAAMAINRAEILIEDGEGRYAEAEKYLGKAEQWLSGGNASGLMSFVHRYRANMALTQGDLEGASLQAKESIEGAKALLETSRDGGSEIWLDPVRTYAEALETAAVIAESRGDQSKADHLFEEAISIISGTTLKETKHAIRLRYAAVLQARGDFEKAAAQYQRAEE